MTTGRITDNRGGEFVRRCVAALAAASMTFGVGALAASPALADDAAFTQSAQGAQGAREATGTRAAGDVSSLGVTLGDGVTGVASVTLNQSDVYAKALAAVVKWRQDALNDNRIRFAHTDENGSTSYLTVADYLKVEGVSTADYLAPKWSNALERIAVQRAVEAKDSSIAHTRPNGGSCFDATYDGVGSSAEILAWGAGDIAGAIDMWASEKDDYIKEVNGQQHGVTGHYTTLVDPDYTRFGFGQDGSTFSGEASGDWLSDTSTDPTNWDGSRQVEVNLSADKVNQGATSNFSRTQAVGRSFQAAYTFKYLSGRYTFKGEWTSSDPSVLSVTSDGRVSVRKVGSAKLVASTDDGDFTATISVHAFADVDDKTPHIDDVDWLSTTGISAGWPRVDGTSDFRGMDSVKRQDMAAFLYRLAGSPAFDADGAKNPFVDVNPSTPHYKEILWLASTGISAGWKRPDGAYEFRGMDSVKRQDMAAFLRRLADYRGAKPKLGAALAFTDVNDATPHSADIAWLAQTGVSAGWTNGGRRQFRGMGDVVRQDMAAFLHRMKDNVL